MKIVKNKKRMMTLITCVLALLIGTGIFCNFNFNKDNVQTATTLHDKLDTTKYEVAFPYNNPTSTNGVRIDGWRTLRDMTTYGPNYDDGCGMTAMGILLQFYNDNSLYAGKILPDNFNYTLESNTGFTNSRANALRGYSLKDKRPNSYIAERDDDLFRLTPKVPVGGLFGGKNATLFDDHKEGLEKFFQIHCPDLNIKVWMGLGDAKHQIDNNRPVLLSMLSYNNDLPDKNGDEKDGKAHVVVAYGYREVDGKTEYLAHSGWNEDGKGTEVWFSPNGNDIFALGYAYIDAPLDRFNTTTITNAKGSAIRIDGLKTGSAKGNLLIPSYLNGLPVVEIGNNAFSGQSGVTSVTFAKDCIITTIGTGAFANCTQLSQITIPFNVTSIGSSAFSGCTNIAGVSFGEENLANVADHSASSYERIDYYTETQFDVELVAGFTYILSFEYIIWNGPANYTEFTNLGVGETNFKDDIKIDKNEEKLFDASKENLFDDTGTKKVGRVITFTPEANELTSSSKLWVRFFKPKIDVNGSIVNVYADGRIKNVRLECKSRLQNIGNSAFSGCSRLSEIKIPSNVTSIGSSAFSNCTILRTITWGDNLKEIKAGAFSGCTYFRGFNAISGDIIISPDVMGNGSLPLENIAINAGNGYLVKVTDLEGVNVLSVNNPNIKIANILKYENGDWFHYSEFEPYSFNEPDMLFPFSGGDYYVLLKNDSAANLQNITFSISKPEQLNINEFDTIEFNGVNSVYYTFTPEYFGNYGFNCSQANALSLYNKDLNFLKSETNYLEYNPLTGGEIYYLKLSKNSGGSSKLIALKKEYIYDLAGKINWEHSTGELSFDIVKVIDHSPQHIQYINDLTSLTIQVKKGGQDLAEFCGTSIDIKYDISAFAFLDTITIKTIFNFSGFEVVLECDYTYLPDCSLLNNINSTGKTVLFVSLSNTFENNNIVITIPANIEVLYIRGVTGYTFTNVQFITAPRTTMLIINLSNFSFTAPTATNAITCNSDLVLNIAGTCRIAGGAGLNNCTNSNLSQINGGIGIKANNLTIAGSGNLEISGGNGGSGYGTYQCMAYNNNFLQYVTLSMYGGNGGRGIDCNNLDANVSNLKVTGGNGGAGWSGGSTGGNGGGGNYGIFCFTLIRINNNAVLNGGYGGAGDKGTAFYGKSGGSYSGLYAVNR